MSLSVASLTVGPLAENSYLLTCGVTRQAVFIDPGLQPEDLWALVERSDAQLQAILLTHAHLDHVGALSELRQRAGVPVYLHPADAALLAQAHLHWQHYGVAIAPIAPAEHALNDDDSFTFGAATLRVIHTPGHTPGGVCFYSLADAILISGDTLFRRGIGRSDLPGGDHTALLQSIRQRLFGGGVALDSIVYPGHGSPTTIREEQENNPFVGIPKKLG